MKSPKLTFLFGALALLIMLAMIQRGKWLSVETVMGAALIVNFGGLSLAYGGAGPGLFFKSSRGTHHPLATCVFGLYFLANGVLLILCRRFERKPATTQVLFNLWFGRVLTDREATRGSLTAVLDLAAELSENSVFRQLPNYRSHPLLDTQAPPVAELEDLTAWVIQAQGTGPVYLHCALGHGRSATVVVAVLLATNTVTTVAEGLQKIQALRPGVQLSWPQHQRLLEWERYLSIKTASNNGTA